MNPPIPYAKEELAIPNNQSVKSEIVFNGITRRTLKFSYREYVNDFARPAFFQDVSYDIDRYPNVVTFKNLQIEITAASNSGITYKVLRGF